MACFFIFSSVYLNELCINFMWKFWAYFAFMLYFVNKLTCLLCICLIFVHLNLTLYLSLNLGLLFVAHRFSIYRMKICLIWQISYLTWSRGGNVRPWFLKQPPPPPSTSAKVCQIAVVFLVMYWQKWLPQHAKSYLSCLWCTDRQRWPQHAKSHLSLLWYTDRDNHSMPNSIGLSCDVLTDRDNHSIPNDTHLSCDVLTDQRKPQHAKWQLSFLWCTIRQRKPQHTRWHLSFLWWPNRQRW